MNPIPLSLAIAVSYLLGAIPFGLLIGLSRGVDVRTTGSGNTGATNVVRSVGKPWGIFACILDIAKGTVATTVVPGIAVHLGVAVSPLFEVLCGLAAVAGHNWPVYLRFKGGKGVATSAGVLLGIAPLAVLFGIGAWLITFFSSRYVSLASIAAAVVIAVAGWWLYGVGSPETGVAVPVFLSVLAALVVWRHRANIQRLSNGTENRFERKK